MKQFLTFLLSVFIGGNAYATECSYSNFTEKHIEVELCQYHAKKSMELLYSARVKVINEYIAEKIKAGELENKKFVINMAEPDFTWQYAHMKRNKSVYYIEIGRIHLSLERLKLIVDAFCNPAFTSIELPPESDFDILKKMDSILTGYAKGTTHSNIFNQQRVVWQQDSLCITYTSKGDSLYYMLHGKTLPYGINFSMPSVIQNRYIIPVALNTGYGVDYFLVYEGNKIVNKYKLPDTDFYDEYDIHSYVAGSWVNFCRYNLCMYSYSYDKNKFYYFNPRIEVIME